MTGSFDTEQPRAIPEDPDRDMRLGIFWVFSGAFHVFGCAIWDYHVVIVDFSISRFAMFIGLCLLDCHV